MRSRLRTLLPAALLLALAWPAAALTIDDTITDLSNDPLAPTAVVLDVGVNVLTGTVTSAGDTRDYLTFTLAPGQALVALNQLVYEDVTTSGPGDRGFHAIHPGTTSAIPGIGTITGFLGADHLDPEVPGTDLLPALGSATLGASGFTPPLGPGDYTYLVQQTGPELTAYTLELVVTPEPALPLLFAVGGLLLTRLPWRRASR